MCIFPYNADDFFIVIFVKGTKTLRRMCHLPLLERTWCQLRCIVRIVRLQCPFISKKFIIQRKLICHYCFNQDIIAWRDENKSRLIKTNKVSR